MKDCIHQFKNKNFIHATILDQGRFQLFLNGISFDPLLGRWEDPQRCATAKADHHSAETESKLGSSSCIMGLAAVVELR